jgi:hypothetical protein
MKSHAYLREKMLHGLVHRKDTGGPVGTKVYQQYADFIPNFAAKAGVTATDLNQPHIDIKDAQVCCVAKYRRRLTSVLWRPALRCRTCRRSWAASSTSSTHRR